MACDIGLWFRCRTKVSGYQCDARSRFVSDRARMGYFAALLRLKPIPNSTPPQFQVAEVINLQALRDEARMHRW